MPFLSEIVLTQFRNFHHRSFRFQSPIVGITGKNGVGKTNLLDAIYYLCYTKSYFQSREASNVLSGSDGFRLEGLWQPSPPGSSAEERTVCIWRDGKKSIQQNDYAYAKVTEHIGKYHAVMIAPDDMEMINGGSDVRRKFMDGLLAQSRPDYLEHLLSYQKALQQKNACLKQTFPGQIRADLLDAYDQQLADHGAYLIHGRKEIAALLPGWVQSLYTKLSDGKESIGVEYRPSAEPAALLDLLLKSRRRDLDLKRTTAGPHTEDWSFLLGTAPLKVYASQGQKKSFLISLKLAQIQWLQQSGNAPLLLLDDVFEKLDAARLSRLFALLQQFNLEQIFLSHTDAEDIGRLMKKYASTPVQLIGLS